MTFFTPNIIGDLRGRIAQMDQQEQQQPIRLYNIQELRKRILGVCGSPVKAEKQEDAA